MRKTLLTILGAAMWLGSQAQSTSPASPLPRLSPQQQDTLRALNTMYDTRRRAGKIWLSVAGVSGAVSGRVLAAATPDTSNPLAPSTSSDSNVGVAVVMGGITGALAAVAISKLVGMSKARQQAVSDTYFATLKMPRSVRRHIKPKYF